MNDLTPCDSTPADLAPPSRNRHAGWTRAKMVTFLRELAASQSVAQAASAVGLTRQSAYRLRDRLVGTPFALGWEVALEAGLTQLAHAMLDRAVNGVEVPHYYKGELVGTSRQYDERLSIWIASNPWKIGRHQFPREHGAKGFDHLLARIESGPLDWTEEEAGDQGSAELRRARSYEGALEGWYGSNP